MQLLIKKQYHSAIQTFNKLVRPSTGIYLWGSTSCDPQSICAKTAREILQLMERKQNTLDQNMLIKEEILVLLDHEKLLSMFNCHALAILTLQEVLRILIQSKYSKNEDHVQYIEQILTDLHQNYASTPSATRHRHDIPSLKILIPRHMGDGPKYLTELWKSKKASSFS